MAPRGRARERAVHNTIVSSEHDSVITMDDIGDGLDRRPLVPVAPIVIEQSALGNHRNFALSFAPTDRIRYERIGDSAELTPIQPLGKVRVKVVDEQGLPFAALQLRVVGETIQKQPIELAMLCPDRFGYAAIDLSHVDARSMTSVRLEPVVIDAHLDHSGVEILADQIEAARDAGLAHEFRVTPEMREFLAAPSSRNGGPSVDFPDAADLRNSPSSFDQSSLSVTPDCNGDENCSLTLARNYATRQFLFHQVVREGSPALQSRNLASVTPSEALG